MCMHHDTIFNYRYTLFFPPQDSSFSDLAVIQCVDRSLLPLSTLPLCNHSNSVLNTKCLISTWGFLLCSHHSYLSSSQKNECFHNTFVKLDSIISILQGGTEAQRDYSQRLVPHSIKACYIE